MSERANHAAKTLGLLGLSAGGLVSTGVCGFISYFMLEMTISNIPKLFTEQSLGNNPLELVATGSIYLTTFGALTALSAYGTYKAIKKAQPHVSKVVKG